MLTVSKELMTRSLKNEISKFIFVFVFLFTFSTVSSFNNGNSQSVNLPKIKKTGTISLIEQKRKDSIRLNKEKKELIEFIKNSLDTIIKQDKILKNDS